MYYILYEGLKIDSNEPVYCIQCTLYTASHSVHRTCMCAHSGAAIGGGGGGSGGFGPPQ